MSLERLVFDINAGRIRGINAKIRGGEVHTLALFLSLKSLNQLYDAVHKMASEVDPRQSTSPSGTKRSKTSSF